MLSGLFTSFFSVGIAELGDKTQLALILLASRTEKKTQLLLGAIIGFVVIEALSVFVGSYTASILPSSLIKIISGIFFMGFGLIMLKTSKEKINEKKTIRTPMVASFVLICVTELGDKTQIAVALLATRFNPLEVFIGSILALSLLSAIAVYIGKGLSKRVDSGKIGRIAAILFIIIGLTFFVS